MEKILQNIKMRLKSKIIRFFHFHPLPMEKEFENNVAQLQPKLLLQFSPNKNNNISEFDRKINNTNLFSTNRLALKDSLKEVNQ